MTVNATLWMGMYVGGCIVSAASSSDGNMLPSEQNPLAGTLSPSLGRFWKKAMKFRARTFSSPQLQREQGRNIYNAYLCVNAPDQASPNDRHAVGDDDTAPTAQAHEKRRDAGPYRNQPDDNWHTV